MADNRPRPGLTPNLEQGGRGARQRRARARHCGEGIAWRLIYLQVTKSPSSMTETAGAAAAAALWWLTVEISNSCSDIWRNVHNGQAKRGNIPRSKRTSPDCNPWSAVKVGRIGPYRQSLCHEKILSHSIMLHSPFSLNPSLKANNWTCWARSAGLASRTRVGAAGTFVGASPGVLGSR